MLISTSSAYLGRSGGTATSRASASPIANLGGDTGRPAGGGLVHVRARAPPAPPVSGGRVGRGAQPPSGFPSGHGALRTGPPGAGAARSRRDRRPRAA